MRLRNAPSNLKRVSVPVVARAAVLIQNIRETDPVLVPLFKKIAAPPPSTVNVPKGIRWLR